MKRLCVFYREAPKWQGREVQWIVCKECQKKIKQGKIFHLILKAYREF